MGPHGPFLLNLFQSYLKNVTERKPLIEHRVIICWQTCKANWPFHNSFSPKNHKMPVCFVISKCGKHSTLVIVTPHVIPRHDKACYNEDLIWITRWQNDRWPYNMGRYTNVREVHLIQKSFLFEWKKLCCVPAIPGQFRSGSGTLWHVYRASPATYSFIVVKCIFRPKKKEF